MQSLYNLIGSKTPKYEDRNLGREVEFSINGKQYKVSDDVHADTSLNVYIREIANLKGTKFMCLEGGCGTCIVSVQSVHPTKKTPHTYSVNSCLVPVFACHGWSITTVEGLGNKNAGYHKIQKRLAEASGTQCGYCTPGMLMNFYSFLQENPKITMKEVEDSLSSNLCRCTGYRPILDAFKSFASDAPNDLIKKLADIETRKNTVRGHHRLGDFLLKPKPIYIFEIACLSTERTCPGKCCSNCSRPQIKAFEPSLSLKFELKNGTSWYRPLSVKEVLEILDMIEGKSYRYISGNTGQGVYRIKEEPQVYIDINGVEELHKIEERNDGITIGANIKLADLLIFLKKICKEKPDEYDYCKTLADHIDLVANAPVRNVGSLAGNLTLKQQNREFPSDLFLLLVLVDATLVIAETSGENKTIPIMEYLSLDMNKKIMVAVNIPVFDSNVYVIKSYKIMPRAQNAHAYVNAGFKFKVDKYFKIMEKPTVLFGGIEPNFLHAVKTEEFLSGKNLVDDDTLKGALTILESEINPDHILPDPSPEYRKGLATSLFYKFVLSVDPSKVSQRNISGGRMIKRPISSGKHDYDTDRNLWPLNKPIPKIEALIQCGGESEYSNDTPNLKEELWGQLVLCDRACAAVSKIDPSEALAIPGVVAFFSAKDIPGENSFVPINYFNILVPEKIFVEERTEYAGQAVGVVIAETNAIAIKAAMKVKITYSDQKEIVRDMRQIVLNNDTERIEYLTQVDPTKEKTDVKYKIEGELSFRTQQAFPMETPTCVVVPVEDRLEVYPSTQWPAHVLEGISQSLAIPESKILVRIRRLGGAFGQKITRSNHVSVVCALAAHLLHRPVRMALKMETLMQWVGTRYPLYFKYETGFNENGEIQYLNVNVYEEYGHVRNDSTVKYGTLLYAWSGYDASTWSLKAYGVLTDSQCFTFTRAPGATEAIFFTEHVMERIAHVLNKDPLSVRLANMNPTNNPLPEMVEDIKKDSDYEFRVEEIEKFNKKNRWKKRGISLIPVGIPLPYIGTFHGTVSIFGKDGSVTVIPGAVEMGQGLNTKAAQVAAYMLGIDLNMVTVQPTNSAFSPNNRWSGSSSTSESICHAVIVCCNVLNERLKPIKEELGPDATWLNICNTAELRSINMTHTHHFEAEDCVNYMIHGVIVTEVEVDILTGQHLTRRVDVIQDAGVSMSPEVDVGQVEGSIIMGLGLYTCEECIYDNDSGLFVNSRTWNYKIPGAKDIPADFRITLRKKSGNTGGVLGSKATGEPALVLSVSVLFAIRNALKSARKDAGHTDDSWFEMQSPFTVERIWSHTMTTKDMFTL